MMEQDSYIIHGDDINLEVQPDNPHENAVQNYREAGQLQLAEINFEVSDATEASEVIEAGEEHQEPQLNQQREPLLYPAVENHGCDGRQEWPLFKRTIILSVITLLIIQSMHISELTQENQEQRNQLSMYFRQKHMVKKNNIQVKAVLTSVQQKCSMQSNILYEMKQTCMQEKEQKNSKEQKIVTQIQQEKHAKQLKAIEQNYEEQSEILSRAKEKNIKLNQENTILKQEILKERQRNVRLAQKFRTLSRHCEEQYDELNKTRNRNKELNLIIAVFKQGYTSGYTRNEDLVQKLDEFQDTCRQFAQIEHPSLRVYIDTVCARLSSYLVLFKSSQRIFALNFELFHWTT